MQFHYYLLLFILSCPTLLLAAPGEPQEILNYDVAQLIGQHLSNKDIRNLKLSCSQWNNIFDYNFNSIPTVLQYVRNNKESSPSLNPSDPQFQEQALDSVNKAAKRVHLALKEPKIVEALIQCGQDNAAIHLLHLKPTLPVVQQALITACQYGRNDIVSAVVSNFLNPEDVTWGHGLEVASTSGHLKTLHLLWRVPAIENVLLQYSISALKKALVSRQLDVATFLASQALVLRLLLKNPLEAYVIAIQAIQVSHEDVLCRLLNNNIIDVNVDDGALLFEAISLKNIEIVNLLLDLGANPTLQNQRSFFKGVDLGFTEGVKSLVTRPTLPGHILDIHQENEKALVSSSAGGHLELARFFLSKGADVHASDDLAICVAATKEMVALIRSHGGNWETRKRFLALNNPNWKAAIHNRNIVDNFFI